jgi:signal transduction histidine kinase
MAAVPPQLEEQVRRAVAEALTNVARHAQAQQVWIDTSLCEDTVEVEVRDDGVGFDSAAAHPPGHYGLVGLRERALLSGGDLAVISTPGAGTSVRFRFPRERVGGRT